MFTGGISQKTIDTSDKGFDALGLDDRILGVLGSIGFEHPTPIQVEVVPVALDGPDVIGLAQTGSGKTAAFCLPMIQALGGGEGPRGLVVCPTREIALQTAAFLECFKPLGVGVACLIGGVRIGPQFDALKKRPTIVVAVRSVRGSNSLGCALNAKVSSGSLVQAPCSPVISTVPRAGAG